MKKFLVLAVVCMGMMISCNDTKVVSNDSIVDTVEADTIEMVETTVDTVEVDSVM